MSSDTATPSMPCNEATLSPAAWRSLFIALILGAIIEFSSRVCNHFGVGNELLLKLLSLFATTLVAVTIVIMVCHTCRKRSITAIMIAAAVAIISSTLLNVTAVLPLFEQIPVLGDDSPIHSLATSIADIIGIAAWIFGFFGLVFEIHHTKSRLSTQHSLLTNEIAERKHAERCLQESEALFRAVFERVDGAIVVMNSEGTILQTNSAFCQELEVEFLDLRGTKIDDLVVEEDLPELRKNVEAVSLQRAASHRGEYRFRHHDESAVWFSVAITPIAQELESENLLVAIVENQTARRERDERVLHQQKLESIGVLAGGIAHDFNNLFVGIMANAELLTQEFKNNSKNAAMCADIVVSTQRSAALCKQLLAYAGKTAMQDQALDLSQLVQASHGLLQMALPRNASLVLACDEGLPAIQADPGQIRQILLNLLSNASDALQGAPGEIRITTCLVALSEMDLKDSILDRGSATPGNYVSLIISDTGTGIPQDTLERLFDPFYTTKEFGSGLGLAAVQGIVRANNGVLAITSVLGTGTEVHTHFPPVNRKAEPLAEVSAPTPHMAQSLSPTSGTVLLVDDDELVLGAARRILEHSKYTVLIAHNGQEGVDLFQENHGLLSVVLLDLVMPIMNGETACLEMQKIDPSVPIIISSGYNETETEMPGSLSGVSGYVHKPYRIQTLLSTISEAIGQRK